MKTINRIAVTVSFKPKFLEWVTQLPDFDGAEWTLEALNDDKSVFLVPEFETNEEAAQWIRPYKKLLLEEALQSVCTEEELWPNDRSEKAFDEYLSAEFSSMIWDLVEGEPI